MKSIGMTMRGRVPRSVTLVATLIVLAISVWGGVRAWNWHNAAQCNDACAVALQNRDWARLETVARDWLSWDATSVNATMYLATAAEQRGDVRAAADALRRVPLDDTAGIEASLRLAGLQFGPLNRPLEGMETCERLRAADPTNSAARGYEIYFLAMTFQRVELIRAVRDAIAVRAEQPEHYLYLLMVDDLSFRDGTEITGRWLAEAPDSELLRAAHAVHAARDARAQALKRSSPESNAAYAAARERVTELLDSYPDNPALIEMQMLHAVDDAALDDLGGWLARVSETEAGDPVFWRYRGWYDNAVGDSERAEQAYRRALELHPLGWQARHELSALLRREQRMPEVPLLQSVAAQGREIAMSIRELEHVRDVNVARLRELAEFASSCGDWEVANGLYRRLPPEQTSIGSD